MLTNIVKDVQLIEATFYNYAYLTFGIVLLLFAINFINEILGRKLIILGIIPRHIIGLPGIFFAPLLHGSFNHLFFNSIPLFCLMNMVLVYGFEVFVTVTLIITILSGLAVWLFGRHSIHLGASAVILGYFGFLSINAYIEPNFLSLVLIICCLYYFGGLVAALIPVHTAGVSVEGHIFGFISGIISFFLLPQAVDYVEQYINLVW